MIGDTVVERAVVESDDPWHTPMPLMDHVTGPVVAALIVGVLLGFVLALLAG